MKVVLENFQLLSGRDGGGGGGGGSSSGSDSDGVDQTVERHSPPPRSAPRAPQPAPQNDFNDEDVPF
jgi:single-strand DNA-binding protein